MGEKIGSPLMHLIETKNLVPHMTPPLLEVLEQKWSILAILAPFWDVATLKRLSGNPGRTRGSGVRNYVHRVVRGRLWGVYFMNFFGWSDFTAAINDSCTQLDREVRGKNSKCQILEM